MTHYSTEQKTRKYVKGYKCLSFMRKYNKELLNTRLYFLTTLPKK